MSVSYEKLAIKTDQRGFVLELLNAKDFAYQQNAHMVLTLPGCVRGNHYHIIRKGNNNNTGSIAGTFSPRRRN